MTQLRTLSLAWFVGLVTLGLASPGCSSDEADSATPIFRYRGPNEFCTEVGNKACSSQVLSGCGLDPAVPSDLTRCAQAVQSHCLAGETDASRRRNLSGAAYQGIYAEPCILAVESAHLDGTLSPTDVADINAKCDVVFSRRSPEGGSCEVKADCDVVEGAAALDCFRDAQGAGVCTTIKLVAAGEACNELGTVCADDGRDLFCNGSNCIVNTGGVAEPCSPGRPCGGAERCLIDPASPATSPTYTCQAKIPADQPCAANEECVSGVCALRFDAQRQVVRLCSAQIQLNNVDVPACGPYRQ